LENGGDSGAGGDGTLKERTSFALAVLTIKLSPTPVPNNIEPPASVINELVNSELSLKNPIEKVQPISPSGHGPTSGVPQTTPFETALAVAENLRGI
jgi:hypothetical protein